MSRGKQIRKLVGQVRHGQAGGLATLALVVIGLSACAVPGAPSKSATAPNAVSASRTNAPVPLSPVSPTSVAAVTVPVTTAPTTAPPTTAPPTTAVTVPAMPHFDTPEAAMVYLAAAWNSSDLTELDQVTSPEGRQALDYMSKELVNLQLDHCTARPGMGDYICYFDHDPLPGVAPGQPGARQAQFVVAPALDPGWYMTVVEVCG